MTVIYESDPSGYTTSGSTTYTTSDTTEYATSSDYTTCLLYTSPSPRDRG